MKTTPAASNGAPAVRRLAMTAARPIAVSVRREPHCWPISAPGTWNTAYVSRKAVNSQPTWTCVRPSSGIIRSAVIATLVRWT